MLRGYFYNEILENSPTVNLTYLDIFRFDSDGSNVIINGLHGESSNPLVREFAYRIFLNPDEHQEELLFQLLTLRNQLAQKCGFSTYSER